MSEWVLGVMRELGLAEHPYWIHVALVLGEPIRGQIITPYGGGFTLNRFECEDDTRVPGIADGRLELFGLEVDLSATEQRRPLWTFPMGRSAIMVEPWRRYAFLDDCRFYARVDWRPGEQETAGIHGGEHDRGRASDADFARTRARQHALLTLKGQDLFGGGRSDEEALEEAADWAAEWLKRHPRHSIMDIGRPQLYETSGMTPKSTANFLTRHHITLPKIRRKLASRDGI